MTAKKATTAAKSQSQKQRFIETARELEVDESGKKFEEAFRKIVGEKRSISGSKKN